jgi:hypothetical protein
MANVEDLMGEADIRRIIGRRLSLKLRNLRVLISPASSVASPAFSFLPSTAKGWVPTELKEIVMRAGEKGLEALKRLYQAGAVNYSSGLTSRDIGIDHETLKSLARIGVAGMWRGKQGVRFFLTDRGVSLAEKLG